MNNQPTFFAESTINPIPQELSNSDEDDINAKNAQGETQLHQAVWKGSLETVQWLLKQPNLKVNLTNNANQTALHTAAKRNDRKKIIQALLSHPHIDINAKDKYKQTALSIIISAYRRECIPLLLAQGADIQSLGNQEKQKNTFQKYIFYKDIQTLKYLMQAGFNTQPDGKDYLEEERMVRSFSQLRGELKITREKLAEGMRALLGKHIEGQEVPELIRALSYVSRLHQRYTVYDFLLFKLNQLPNEIIRIIVIKGLQIELSDQGCNISYEILRAFYSGFKDPGSKVSQLYKSYFKEHTNCENVSALAAQPASLFI